MTKTKIENWNGYDIRFVEYDGEWWAIAKDVASALGFERTHDATKYVPNKYKGGIKSRTLGGAQEMSTLSELGIYRLIMRSNKSEAEAFQDWVFNVIKELRQATGLEGFQVFKMLDKEHQKEAMARLNNGLRQPTKQDYIKANTIANKAICNNHGMPKMVGKDKMSAEMLKEREPILDSTVNLINLNEEFNLGVSISETVYDKFC